MKPTLISAVVLAASLSVAAGTAPSTPAAQPQPTCVAATSGVAASGLSGADRAELRAVELRDADLSQVKAGFMMTDDDTMLVLGTIAVVVLIAILL